MTIARLAVALCLLTTVALAGAQAPGWTQWGGPSRNFVAASTGLAASWPAAGPRRLWSRALGEGHSAILADGGRLYTMYRPLGLLATVRRSTEEMVVALDGA